MQAAITCLELALETMNTNAPINEAEGNLGQSDLERLNAASYRKALDVLRCDKLISQFQLDEAVTFTTEGPDPKPGTIRAVKYTRGKVLYDVEGLDDGVLRPDIKSEYVHELVG